MKRRSFKKFKLNSAADLQKGRAQRKRARPFVYHGAGSDRQTDAFTVVQGLDGPGTVASRAGGRRWQPVVRSSSSEAQTSVLPQIRVP